MATFSQVSAPVWDDSYCVGSEMIDIQHKRLFELLEPIRGCAERWLRSGRG